MKDNGVAFCGSWSQDKYNGAGTYIAEDSSVQEGMLVNNLFEGQSKRTFIDGRVQEGHCTKN